MNQIEFDKYQACGNDFVIINNCEDEISIDPASIQGICSRNFGVGADGLILVERRDGELFMNYFNSDGSPAEICGNGLRCMARYAQNNGLIPEGETEMEIKAESGPVKARIEEDGLISVFLPPADFSPEAIGLELDEPVVDEMISFRRRHFRCGCCSMGNPHMVFFNVPFVEKFPDVDSMGKFFSEHELFKEGVNVGFAQILDENNIILRTYERGDGETMACGTGACAAVNVLHANGLVGRDVDVKVPGGTLHVHIDFDKTVLTGPADKVFSGKLEVKEIE